MRNKNAILFSRVDREDYWVSSGIAFNVSNTDTYEDAYNEIKEKLETPEMIKHVIEDSCLEDDLFEGDETYKFVKTYWEYGLFYVFKNEDGDEVEHRFSADFILVQ
jgi:hypothetical protein